MAKIINQNKDIVLAIAIGLVLTITGVMGMYSFAPSNIDTVEAVATSVEITATVQEWMTLTSNTTSTTLSPDLVSTAGVTSVATSSSIILTAKTNSADGYKITLTGANDGLDWGSTSTIGSVSATGTVAAGTDIYGAEATSASSTIGSNYDHWGDTTVGEIKTGGQTFASKTTRTEVAGHEITMVIKASCVANKENGSYTDTITLTMVAAAP
ncbi:hypothetical protein KAS79_03885 [Candidatus Parcubacteria bacterium]|nr:hypothetical protein [Candidatus Parcubacteria bacterium]